MPLLRFDLYKAGWEDKSRCEATVGLIIRSDA